MGRLRAASCIRENSYRSVWVRKGPLKPTRSFETSPVGVFQDANKDPTMSILFVTPIHLKKVVAVRNVICAF